MRNFEERRAEIFRRSEERIKEQRKNRLMFCYIPLMVLISIGSLMLIPTTIDRDNATPQQEAHQPTQTDYDYVQLVVIDQDGNRIRTLTDPARLQAATSILLPKEAINDFDDFAPEEDNTEDYNTVPDSVTNANRNLTYTLKLTHKNGTVTEYTFTDHQLYFVETKTTITLNENLNHALRKLLELE